MKLKIIIAALFAVVSLSAQTFKVDQAHTSVSFKVKHLMISNVVGNFETFAGTFEYDPKSETLSDLSGVVMVKSINTSIEKRDNHLRSADFFHAEKYPKMTLETVSIDGNDLIADLTIKGITRKVIFKFENGGTVIAPSGVRKAAFSLQATIVRQNFGLTWNKVLETGGVVVGDEVHINIEVEGDAIE